MTNQDKPKCGVGQSCGYSCISIKDTCKDKVDPGASAGLISLVQNAALYKAKSMQSFTSAADEDKSFDELAAKYPFKAGVEPVKEKIGDLDVWYMKVDAADDSGDSMTYAVALKGKRSFTLSDGNVKEVLASDANARLKEGLAAALRAKARTNLSPKPDIKQEPEATTYVAFDAKAKREQFDEAQEEYRSAVRTSATNSIAFREAAEDYAATLRPDFTKNGVTRLALALRSKAVDEYYRTDVGPPLKFSGGETKYSDRGHDQWTDLDQAAAASLITGRPNKAAKAAIQELSEASGIATDDAARVAESFAKHISDGFVTAEASLSIAMGGDTAKALDKFYAGAPKYKGTIYKGMGGLDPAVLDQWQSEGIKQDLLTSWTSDKTVPDGFIIPSKGKVAVVLETENKTGVSARAFAISRYKDQDEVIGKPNTAFKVTRIEDRTDGRGRLYKHVFVEEA